MTVAPTGDGSAARPTPAVTFAAKSTPDDHGSIPTQQADARALADRESLHIVAEYIDEAVSAFTSSRGDGLARAKDHAERLAAEHGTAALVVQHSDRLARGDGRIAAHLVEYALWALKANVTIHSVHDPQTFADLLYAVVTGQRNHEDSARKSSATKAGKLRRHENEGRASGPVHDGYMLMPDTNADRTLKIDRAGKIFQRRVHDPKRTPIILRIFAAFERGSTPGDIARTLNDEGLRTARGKQWTARRVRDTLSNAYYRGVVTMHGDQRPGDHEPIIDPDRFDAIQTQIARMDPAAVQRRKGGRRPIDTSYLLRGVAFCGRCGQSMYTRPYASGRHYICASVREARGTCDAPKILAASVEGAFLSHLSTFFDGVDGWLHERESARHAERGVLEAAADRQRERLATLERTRANVETQYLSLMHDGDDLADVALRQLGNVEAERDEQRRAVEDADARVSEWTAAPAHDAARVFYRELSDLIEGRVSSARSADDLSAVLGSLLQGAWMQIDGDGRLALEVVLTDSARYVGHQLEAGWLAASPLIARFVGYELDVEPDVARSCRTSP